jgi:hypothetical protein
MVKATPEIAIFMARIGPMHHQQLASLANTLCDFDLIYRYGPGTAHENINEVIDRSTSRYLCICDDDVEFLDPHWLTTLINVLKEFEEAGMVVPVELKTEETRNIYVKNGWCEEVPKPDFDVMGQTWLPGYVMLFDRERVPELRSDEDIPGPSGMSDLDLSLQVRSIGMKCALTSRTVVYHPTKPLDKDWRERWSIVQEDDLPELNRQQIMYMADKWGVFFTDAIGRTNCGSF